jgi:hypothetical protein
MFERGISAQKVRTVVQSGTIIEDYSSEMPEPGQLILGFQGKQPFHVVTSGHPEENMATIITVYKPDSNKWSKDFKKRRP